MNTIRTSSRRKLPRENHCIAEHALPTTTGDALYGFHVPFTSSVQYAMPLQIQQWVLEPGCIWDR